MTRRLNATAASLLGFLHERPMAGWDLLATAQERIGNFWSVNPSQIYRELASMSASGLILAGDTGPRDRKPYSITAEGRSAFAAWIDQEPGLENIRFPLLLTVAFASHLSTERLAVFLTSHRAQHAARLAGYYQQKDAADAAPPGAVDPVSTATLAFGIAYEQAVLGWFDSVGTTLVSDTDS